MSNGTRNTITYFFGTALITAAVFDGAGLDNALIVAGSSLMIYTFCRILAAA